MPNAVERELQYHESQAAQLRNKLTKQQKKEPQTLAEKLAAAQQALAEVERKIRCRTQDLTESLDQLSIAQRKRDGLGLEAAVMSDETRAEHRAVYTSVVARFEGEVEAINRQLDELRPQESAARNQYEAIWHIVKNDPLVFSAQKLQEKIVQKFGEVILRAWSKTLVEMIPDLRAAKELCDTELRVVLETRAILGVKVVETKLHDAFEKCHPTFPADEVAFKSSLRSVRSFLETLGYK